LAGTTLQANPVVEPAPAAGLHDGAQTLCSTASTRSGGTFECGANLVVAVPVSAFAPGAHGYQATPPSVTLLLGTGVGQAATLGQGPQFFTPGVNQFRATGSETTYYVMNAVGNLYSQSSIYGCTLSATDFRTCVTTADGSATDTVDDYSRNEFINGEGVGTGNGVGQLCGSKPTGGLTVDFARGSRAPNAGDNCPSAVALEFARDSVVGVEFPFHNKSTVACTGTCTATQVGPVSAGWRPGDALAGPYSGVAVANIDNTAQVPGSGHSLAFEIYCDTTTSFKINDW